MGSELWYVGVMLEIVSTMSGTIGKQLIRFSEHKKREKRVYFAKCALYAGLVVNTVFGPIVDMAAYSFAPQSLIAPFGGLDVVWNALLAPCFLKEKLTPRRLAGCVIIVIGTIMAGCFGNHTDSEYTLESLEETLINSRVLFYFLVFFVWFLFNRFVLMRRPKGSILRGLSLGCTAGTIAGNMFCVKAAIELIERSIHKSEPEIWLHWLPWAVLAGAIFFALTNVIYMTQGLQEYEALFMVTIYEGSMIASGCISGSVVLLDLRGLEPWRVGLYGLSVLVVVVGMGVIFSQEMASKSSLYAGTASIHEEELARRRKVIVDQKLQERSQHALVPIVSESSDNNTPRPSSLSPMGLPSPLGLNLWSSSSRQLSAALDVEAPRAPMVDDVEADTKDNSPEYDCTTSAGDPEQMVEMESSEDKGKIAPCTIKLCL